LAALQANPALLSQLGGGGGGGGFLAALQSNPGLLAQLRQGSGSSGGLAGAIQSNPALLAALTKGQSSSATATTTPPTPVSHSKTSTKHETSSANHIEPSHSSTSVRVLPPLKYISSPEVILPASTTIKPASSKQVPAPKPGAPAAAAKEVDAPTKSPSGVDLSAFLKNPAVQKLVKEHPEIVDQFNQVTILYNVLLPKFTNVRNELECLPLTGLSSLLYSLDKSLTRVEHLKGA
jgi:hypothetical protein